MLRKSTVRLALLIFAAVASPAFSATVAFSGSFQNTNPPASPTGRCAPAAFTVNINASVGTVAGSSNFGSFTPTASHCINPPLPTTYSDGRFSFDFGSGNILTGTYFGTLSNSATPGVFANLQQFAVTGGTGVFLNATGAFTGTGTVSFVPNQPPFSTETLAGTLELPAVPEPSVWLMMVVGFATIGWGMRHRARSPKPSRSSAFQHSAMVV